MQYFVFRYVLDLHSAIAQVFLCLCSCLRLSSDRNLSRTHCEKFDFLAAKSHDVGSRVMSFCLIFTRKLAFRIYISQESPWAIPRKIVVWLLCHGGGGDKELGGGHSLSEPSGRLRREDSIRVCRSGQENSVVYTPALLGKAMATAKTGSFYLTETITLPAATASGTRVQGSIDLGAYVNVATGQAVAVESVDFVFQVGADYGSDGKSMIQSDGAIGVQLSDLNPGTAFVRADDQSLIASGSLNIDQTNNVVTHVSDLYPDNFGPSALSEAFMVVNDTMYLVAGPDLSSTNATASVFVTARIKCRIVKLGTKDWMAIAIQSTASDN